MHLRTLLQPRHISGEPSSYTMIAVKTHDHCPNPTRLKTLYTNELHNDPNADLIRERSTGLIL